MNRVVQRANQVDSVLSADGRRPERLGARYRRGQTRSRRRRAVARGGALEQQRALARIARVGHQSLEDVTTSRAR